MILFHGLCCFLWSTKEWATAGCDMLDPGNKNDIDRIRNCVAQCDICDELGSCKYMILSTTCCWVTHMVFCWCCMLCEFDQWNLCLANDQKILTLPLNFKLQHFRISQITSIFRYHHFVNNPWNKNPNMRCDMKQKKQLQHGSFRGSRSSEIPRVSSGRSGPCLANSCRYKRGCISHTLSIHPEKPIEQSLFHTFFLNS